MRQHSTIEHLLQCNIWSYRCIEFGWKRTTQPSETIWNGKETMPWSLPSSLLKTNRSGMERSETHITFNCNLLNGFLITLAMNWVYALRMRPKHVNARRLEGNRDTMHDVSMKNLSFFPCYLLTFNHFGFYFSSFCCLPFAFVAFSLLILHIRILQWRQYSFAAFIEI